MIVQKFLEIIKSVVLISAGLYFFLLACFYFFQSKLVYFPSRKINATPDEAGLKYDEVSFTAADGVGLSGWFVPAASAEATLLFCTGNAGNISDRIESIKIFNRLRLNVLIFDYRGYGKSEGRPEEEGTYSDAEAAWQYLVDVRKISPGKIIVFGRSLGGAVAAHLAAGHNPGALILESAFTSLKDLGSQLYPYLPVRLLGRFEYDTQKYVSEVKSPVLIIHSRDDEMVDIKHGQSLFNSAREPKEFFEITGSHNEGFVVSGESYVSRIESFLHLYEKR